MPYRRHREGEPLDSTNLQDNLTEMGDKVNKVRRERLIRKALRREHIPSYVPPGYDWTTANDLLGLSSMTVIGGNSWTGSWHKRKIDQAAWSLSAPTFTDWQVFETNPYGVTPSSVGIPNGWRIPQGIVTERQERAIPVGTLQEFNILANFSMNLTDVGVDITDWDSDPTAAVVCIGIRDDNNPIRFFCIERSIRIFPRDGFQFGDVGTFCLITQDDVDAFEQRFQLAPGTAQITRVFGAVSSLLFGMHPTLTGVSSEIGPTGRILAAPPPTSDNVGGIRIDRANFDILPVQKGGID